MAAPTEEALVEVAKAVATTTAENAATVNALNTNSFLINLFGYQFNLITILAVGMIIGVLILFYRIQASQKLDFADMFTKDGRKVSATKVLQFVGGMASTWFIVKQGLSGTLSSEIFGIYLAYIASIEGFSKFISAKYNYTETSVRDATPPPEDPPPSTDDLPPGDGPIEKTTAIATVKDGQVKQIKRTTVRKG